MNAPANLEIGGQPRLPRLRHGIGYLVLDDEIVFHGGYRREVFGGTGAAGFLPKLLPLMDGTQDTGAIAARLDAGPAVVTGAIELLWQRGLVEDGDGAPDLTTSPAVRALARLGGATMVNRHAGQAIDRLAAATVSVHGRSELVGPLETALRDAGIGGVRCANEFALADLAVVVVGPGEAPPHALANRYAERHIAVLPVFVAGKTVALGPILEPGTGICYPCVAAESRPPGAESSVDSGSLFIHCGLICREIIALIARTPRESTIGVSVRHDLSTWETEQFAPAPQPGCAVCLPESAGITSTIPLALRYEYAVTRKPADRESPSEQTHAGHPQITKLTARTRTWPSARLLPLPEVPAIHAAREGRAGAAPLTLDEIAVLVSRVAGRRDPRGGGLERWAPSGGNLGSPVLYLALPDGDVPGGLYGYDVEKHALAEFARGPGPAESLLRAGDTALIVLTADIAKIKAKYGAFSLALGGLDSGVALAQLDYVARALGRQVESVDRRLPRRLAGALDIDTSTEPVTGLVSLR